ncbi:GreA/GreB family elongation factor [Verrucomicrobiaceae bacterium 5K15]|uniref:Transcription elongation factor GreA n=1 Tax=Oceaniferula flava TaxID=2800421 RepID=A0AAE2SCV1_9BACT|nr:GreA/GreB family elongation factor [Oceaniferula flavus]MBK1855871.1 GreA/GreB family elongation factor [Oceaniferula flavus]MBM1137178.1 GreA/GreB family elongation factor [Oceaniferula flavus]
MHPDVAKLVEAGRIPQAVGERLSEIAPGKFCSHKTWGAGKVESWDLSSGKVVIDFEKQSSQEMALQFAIQKTEPLEEDHFSARKLDNIGELRAMVDNDPVELVKRTLESHDGSMMLDQLDRELCGSVVPEEGYKKWWEKAKKALRESHIFSVPSKRTDPLVLRGDSLSPADTLLVEFTETRDPKVKIKALENIRKNLAVFEEGGTELTGLIDSLNKFCQSGRKLHLSTVLEFLVARDEIVQHFDSLELADSDLRLANVLTTEHDRLVGSLKGRSAATQRKIFESFPEAFGDVWQEEMLKVFDEVGSRGVTEIARYMLENGQDEIFSDHLAKSIANRSLGPDALIWICREREKSAAQVFTFETGNSILNLLDRDHVADGPSKSVRLRTMLMSDKTLIADILADADEAEARQFGRKLYQSPVFTDLDRKSLMARVIKARPETQDLVTGEFEKKIEGVTSSRESIERRKKELDEIVKVRIPENTKEISVARSYGDLRENFEYKAAKDMQAVLMRRKAQMEKELRHVQATDFKNVDTSEVNIGTIVNMEDDAGNPVKYTILGAWDSIAEENIVSYLSDVGMTLIGAKPGDVLDVRDLETEKNRKLTVVSIEAYNKG